MLYYRWRYSIYGEFLSLYFAGVYFEWSKKSGMAVLQKHWTRVFRWENKGAFCSIIQKHCTGISIKYWLLHWQDFGQFKFGKKQMYFLNFHLYFVDQVFPFNFCANFFWGKWEQWLQFYSFWNKCFGGKYLINFSSCEFQKYII